MIYLTIFSLAQYLWLNDLRLISDNVYSISVGRSSKLLPAVASRVSIAAESSRTQDRILLSLSGLWESCIVYSSLIIVAIKFALDDRLVNNVDTFTLHITVFNSTLSISVFTLVLHVSAKLGSHQVLLLLLLQLFYWNFDFISLYCNIVILSVKVCIWMQQDAEI
jgi:hypothetical protein